MYSEVVLGILKPHDPSEISTILSLFTSCHYAKQVDP